MGWDGIRVGRYVKRGEERVYVHRHCPYIIETFNTIVLMESSIVNYKRYIWLEVTFAFYEPSTCQISVVIEVPYCIPAICHVVGDGKQDHCTLRADLRNTNKDHVY